MKELLRGLSSADIKNNPDFYQVTPDGKLLKEIQDNLSEVVFGQDRAIRDTARAMLRALGGMSDPTRPEFSALFAGPTGVGKTEMGKAIAHYYNPQAWQRHLMTIDCSNFQQDFDVHKLTGSNPGYVGWGSKPIIDPDFLNQGRTVIVFDEIEKAHPALHKVLLSILDQGRLTVPIGTSAYRNVENVDLDFTNSSLIFTSNLGSGEMQAAKEGKSIGFRKDNSQKDIYEIGLKAVKDHFKFMPEFLNRLDTTVIFDDLTPPVYKRILDKFIDRYNNFQRVPNYMALTQEAKDYVISKTNQKLGGRELRRMFDKLIITPASEVKISLPQGQPFIADLSDEEQVIFWTAKVQKPEEPSNIILLEEAKKKEERSTNGTEGDDDRSDYSCIIFCLPPKT